MILGGLITAAAGAAEPQFLQDPNFPLIQLPGEYDSHRTTKRFEPKPGEEGVEILNAKGPGCVRHFWITSTASERLEIEINCDDAEQPQIKMSMNRFFGVLLGQKPYRIESAPIKLLPKSGFNSYFPIPFQKSCRIILRNSSRHGTAVWSMVNWQKYEEKVKVTPLRLHAIFTETPKAEPLGTMLLGSIEGRGFVAGMFHAIKRFDRADMIWHTGGDTWLIDGETNPHVLRGIGSEDVFCYSFGVYKDLSQWVGGVHAVGENADCSEVVAYRFFGVDSVAFKSSLVLRFGTRANRIENLLYYYKDMNSSAPDVETPKQWTLSGSDHVTDFEAFAKETLVKPPPPRQPERGQPRLTMKKDITVTPEHTWVDFSRWLRFNGHGNTGTQPHHCSADAATVITSEKARKATLVLAFDDWLKVWLNGEPVAAICHDDGVETVAIPMKLEQGENRLVIRLSNFDNTEWRCWAFSCVIKNEEKDGG